MSHSIDNEDVDLALLVLDLLSRGLDARLVSRVGGEEAHVAVGLGDGLEFLRLGWIARTGINHSVGLACESRDEAQADASRGAVDEVDRAHACRKWLVRRRVWMGGREVERMRGC